MAEPKTCFLIDDDYDDQFIFTLALKEISGSLTCLAVDNASDALKQLEKNFTPDYIFLDLNMPGVNGIECLMKIKKMKHLRHVPVIIYSTSSSHKDIMETGALGASAFITKPYDLADLSKKLSDFFQLQ